MPVLLCPQQIAGAANLQIPHCNLKARTQLGIFPNRRQTFFRQLAQCLILLIGQIRIGNAVAASHTAPQLIKLGQTHFVSLVYNHSVGIGNVQSGFNDCGTNQNVCLMGNKFHHDLLQLMLLHLSVSHQNAGFRHQLPNLLSQTLNILHTVVHDIHLTASAQLPANAVLEQFRSALHNISLNGITVLRRRLDDTHIPNAHQRHMQRTRNRRCR